MENKYGLVSECCSLYQIKDLEGGDGEIRKEFLENIKHLWTHRLSELMTDDQGIKEWEVVD